MSQGGFITAVEQRKLVECKRAISFHEILDAIPNGVSVLPIIWPVGLLSAFSLFCLSLTAYRSCFTLLVEDNVIY